MTARHMTYRDYSQLSSEEQSKLPAVEYQRMVEADAAQARARFERANRHFESALVLLKGLILLGFGTVVVGIVVAVLS